MFITNRNQHNPILKPSHNKHWSAVARFNWSPVKIDGTYHAFYRAMAKPDYMHGPNLSLSTVGVAESTDGVHYEDHRQIIVPDNEWEMYGCEDPRATTIDGLTYVFYTALSGYPFNHDNIKVAVAVTDDCKHVIEKHQVTPFNAKAMTFFPEKVNGKFLALLTVHPDMPPSSICFASFDKIEDVWSKDYWRGWYANYQEHKFNLIRKEGEHVEIGASPVKTDHGWLLLYSHIFDYFTDKPKFGVEAVLLDLNNPTEIIARSNYPFLVPETFYEKSGQVENIVFPSGALIEDNKIELFYGGADTVCCLADINAEHLIASLDETGYKEGAIRSPANPILVPKEENAWEAYSVFNPAAIDIDGTVHIIYRAMSHDNTSVMGYASSKDGLHIDEKLEEPIYIPRADFEMKKKPPNGYSGCEDPRVTLLDGRVYMAYTAYDGINPPSIAMTSITVEDLQNKNWNWDMPQLISPVNVDDKDACLFSEKIMDQYVVMHRMQNVICLDYVESLNFEEHKLDKCIQLIGPRPGMWDSMKVGIAGPPMKTDYGWLLLYHGVSDDAIYRVGAALLDIDNPANVISRMADYIFEPKEPYELQGQVGNVVFPCGSVIRDGKIFIYYGGGDSVVGVATLDYKVTMDRLLG